MIWALGLFFVLNKNMYGNVAFAARSIRVIELECAPTLDSPWTVPNVTLEHEAVLACRSTRPTDNPPF